MSLAWDVAVFAVLSLYYLVEALVTVFIPRKFLFKDISDEVVLITGAGGGLGRLLAQKFSSLGAVVVIWDINPKELNETARLLKEDGKEVYSYTCDLSDKEDIYLTAKKVKTEVGKVTILVNNAGVVFGRTLLDLPDDKIENTFQVNILSHYWTTKAFLKEMTEDNHGHVVTIASVAGLMGLYRCTDYSATKFAAVGFHESLFTELQAQGFDEVYTTLICPYFINTGMFDGAKPRLMPMLEPEDVADEIVSAVLTNEITVTLPRCVRWMLPLKGILPAKMSWALMYHVIQGPQSMMTFRGH